MGRMHSWIVHWHSVCTLELTATWERLLEIIVKLRPWRAFVNSYPVCAEQGKEVRPSEAANQEAVR